MKGLTEALNRLATHEVSRAYKTANKKEDCRMSDSYSGCKHNAVRNVVASKALVDISESNYVPHSEGDEIESLYHPTEVGTWLLDGVYILPDGDYYVIELKADEVWDESY